MARKSKIDLIREGKSVNKVKEISETTSVPLEIPKPSDPVPFKPTVSVKLSSKKTKKSANDPNSVVLNTDGSAVIVSSDTTKIISNTGNTTSISTSSDPSEKAGVGKVLYSSSSKELDGSSKKTVITEDGVTTTTSTKLDGSTSTSISKGSVDTSNAITGVTSSIKDGVTTSSGFGVTVSSDDLTTTSTQGSKSSTSEQGLITTIDKDLGITSVVDTNTNTITSTDSLGNETIQNLLTGEKSVKDVATGLTTTFDASGKILTSVPTPDTLASGKVETPGSILAKSAVDAANLAAIATKPGDDVLAFVKKYAPKLLTMLKDPTKLLAILTLVSGAILVIQKLDIKALTRKSNKTIAQSADVAKKASDTAGKKAKSLARKVYEKVMANVRQAYDAMKKSIKNAATHEAATLSRKWEALKKAYNSLLDDAKKAWKAIVDLYKATKALIKAKWNAATAPKTKVPPRATASLQDRIAAANAIRAESVAKAAKAVEIAKLVSVASQAFTTATRTLTKLAGTIALAIANVINMAAGLLTYVMSMGVAITAAGVGFLASVPGAVVKGFST